LKEEGEIGARINSGGSVFHKRPGGSWVFSGSFSFSFAFDNDFGLFLFWVLFWAPVWASFFGRMISGGTGVLESRRGNDRQQERASAGNALSLPFRSLLLGTRLLAFAAAIEFERIPWLLGGNDGGNELLAAAK